MGLSRLWFWLAMPFVYLGIHTGSRSFSLVPFSDSQLKMNSVGLIPPRSKQAPSGSEALAYVDTIKKKSDREQWLVNQFLSGNVPSFARHWVPVHLKYWDPLRLKLYRAVIWVTNHYLTIGSDEDYAFLPLNLTSALEISRKLGIYLPTTRIVDHTYTQAELVLKPEPLSPGPLMEEPVYFRRHNQLLRAIFGSRILKPALGAGYKKDVVLSNILNRKKGRIAIYGWHRGVDQPIQPLSTAHHKGYADYSHGIRFVHPKMLLNKKPVYLKEVLKDKRYARILNREGAIERLEPILRGEQ